MIFVLYRFTTFFAYLYSVLKFVIKLFSWIKNNLFKKSVYHEIPIDNESLYTKPRIPIFKRIKTYVSSFFRPIMAQYTILPETFPPIHSPIHSPTNSYISSQEEENVIQHYCLNNIDSNLLDNQYGNMPNSEEYTPITFETKHIINPLTNPTIPKTKNYISNSTYSTSNYGSIYDNLRLSQSSYN